MPEINHQDTIVSFSQLAQEISNDSVTALRLKNVIIEGDDRDMKFSRTLRGHPRLQELSLVNVQCPDPEANLNGIIEMSLVTCWRMKTLRIEGTKVSYKSLAATSYCPTLKNLLLPNNDYHDEEAATIATAVAQNTAIEHVDLTGNDMTDLGCASFAKALEKNISLRILRLDGNAKISGGALSKIGLTLSERSAKAA